MGYRNSKSFGERYEYIAISELLQRGFDVYKTLVDDQGIDCIVRQIVNAEPKYVDLQIKARSNAAKDPATFAAMQIPDPRPNYAFMFYSENLNESWIIPSLDLTDGLAYRNKTGKNAGSYRLDLCRKNKGSYVPKTRFDVYRGQNGFAVLETLFKSI